MGDISQQVYDELEKKINFLFDYFEHGGRARALNVQLTKMVEPYMELKRDEFNRDSFNICWNDTVRSNMMQTPQDFLVLDALLKAVRRIRFLSGNDRRFEPNIKHLLENMIMLVYNTPNNVSYNRAITLGFSAIMFDLLRWAQNSDSIDNSNSIQQIVASWLTEGISLMHLNIVTGVPSPIQMIDDIEKRTIRQVKIMNDAANSTYASTLCELEKATACIEWIPKKIVMHKI